MNGGCERLRALLKRDGMLVVPGAYDCLSAMVVERLGFEAVYLTGYGAEACLLGRPDIGLITLEEMARHASNIAAAVTVPLISDADTGFGNAINVWRTVERFGRGGVAAIHLEDQVTPKKCANMPGRVNITIEEMTGKIRAAKAAAEESGLLIIARADAKGHGAEEVVRRLDAYFAAGADLVMVAERHSPEELQWLLKRAQGPLVAFAGHPMWPESVLPNREYERMGVKVLIYAATGLWAAAKAVNDLYAVLREQGGLEMEVMERRMMPFDECNRVLRLPEWLARESEYLPAFTRVE